MSTITSITALVAGWGSAKSARRVTRLTSVERTAIRAGATVFIANCPAVRGITTRRVVEINGRFYARMPTAAA